MSYVCGPDIFQPQIMPYLSRPPHLDPASSPTDLDLSLVVREKSRIFGHTGTDFGDSEGSGHISLFWRNILGGAETLSLNASAGTRTRSAYGAELSAPLFSNPDLRASIEGLASSTQKSWASHEEISKGGAAKLYWTNRVGDRFQLGYSGTWRQVTGLAGGASPSVRSEAGDSVKSALSCIFSRDRRDNPMLPQSGYLVKMATELAGWGSLGGDVGFSKTVVDVAGALPVPIPGIRSPSGLSIGVGLRAGLLYPLPLNYGIHGAAPSRLSDRFTLGGPTDVRGFALGGLGPRDGPDAVGGDVFAAANANMFIPLPRLGPESPFRLQLFANSGRLVAMKNTGNKGDQAARSGLDAGSVWEGLIGATKDLTTGMPSLSAGFGLVYAHPVARVELNFALPIVVRRGEEDRKGLQFGLGIHFL